jgi:hypothetical protein
MTTTAASEQRQLVQVRSRPWVVNEVKPSSLPTPATQLPVAKTLNLLTLSSVEDDGLGEELQQLTLFDDLEKDDLEKDQFERNRGFPRKRSRAIPAEIKRETAAIVVRERDIQVAEFSRLREALLKLPEATAK